MSERSPVLVRLPADRCDITTLRAVLNAIGPGVIITLEGTVPMDRHGLVLEADQTLRFEKEA